MKLRSSPWGQPQHQSTLIPGIVQVSTASHGGFHLSPSRLAELPASVRDAERFNSPGPWYEEDAEVYIVAVAFPEVAKACGVAREAAIAGLKRWYPKIAGALGV